MKNYLPIYANASKLRAMGNAYIVRSLEKAGLKGIVTVLVDKLEREGYVSKKPDPEDSRGVLVELTAKGRALEPVFQDISDGLNELIANRLSKEEIDQLNALLQKCVD